MSDRFFNEQAMRRKVEQARREREAAERAEKIRQEKEAAKKRPHCQAVDQALDGLCQRILARAERHRRAADNLRLGIVRRPATPAARVRWAAAVEKAVAECGGNKMAATALANRRHPGLREAYLAEVNGR